MNYNDIDQDVLLYAKKGLDISELFEQSGNRPFENGFYAVKQKHYIPLLLLMPNEAQKRDEIHLFLEMFEKAIFNNDFNQREDLEEWVFIEEKIKYVINFSTIYKMSLSEPLEPNDFDIEHYGICDTVLPNNVLEWLESACKEILEDYSLIRK